MILVISIFEKTMPQNQNVFGAPPKPQAETFRFVYSTPSARFARIKTTGSIKNPYFDPCSLGEGGGGVKDDRMCRGKGSFLTINFRRV